MSFPGAVPEMRGRSDAIAKIMRWWRVRNSRNRCGSQPERRRVMAKKKAKKAAKKKAKKK